MRVVVTGFMPFGEESRNPSWEAVKRLPQEIEGAVIRRVELPVVFGESLCRLEEVIGQEEPDIVICVGQAGGRCGITPEWLAVNVRDSKSADNAGRRFVGERVDIEGPAAYETTLPVRDMVRAMQEAGIPASLSYSAGTYVCNDLMYGLLHLRATRRTKPDLRAGFIHIPFDEKQAVEHGGNTAFLPLDMAVQGLKICVRQAVSAVKTAAVGKMPTAGEIPAGKAENVTGGGRVLNFGSLNIDYTYQVPHFVTGGETLGAIGLEQYPGGKGLNQSVALARSGAKVWHGGAVGEADGGILVTALQEAGVRTEKLLRLEAPSGHAIIQRDEKGQNCILVHSSANGKITREMADAMLEDFGEGDFLVLQNETAQVGYIMAGAKARKMRVIFNPSPITEEIKTYPLEAVDIFILNETEGRALGGLLEDAGEEEVLVALGERFPQAAVVLTLGEKGCMYRACGSFLRQPAFGVRAVDTTAAGDTFTGYFVGALAEGRTTAEALLRACAAAAIAVTRSGASPSVPERAEVEELLRRQREERLC